MHGTGKHPMLVALVAGAALLLGGCNATPTGPAAASRPPSASSTQTLAAGYGASQDPASSAPPAASDEPTVMPTTASATLYYIARDDAGVSGPPVGCGDSAVAVTSASITFTDPVEGALRTLLADHSQQLGQSGLDNALWQSRLQVQSVERNGSTITAHLAGTLKMGGECDIPRVEEQLLLTTRQAAGGPVAITINGKTLRSALSLK